MLTNEVTLNIYLLVIFMAMCVFAGFAFRAKIILRYREKIEELERDILANCSTILDLERETLKLESQAEDMKIPVIAMNKKSSSVNLHP